MKAVGTLVGCRLKPAFQGVRRFRDGKVLRKGSCGGCCLEGLTGRNRGKGRGERTKKRKLARQAMKIGRARSMRLWVKGGPGSGQVLAGTRAVNSLAELHQPSVMMCALKKMRWFSLGTPKVPV